MSGVLRRLEAGNGKGRTTEGGRDEYRIPIRNDRDKYRNRIPKAQVSNDEVVRVGVGRSRGSRTFPPIPTDFRGIAMKKSILVIVVGAILLACVVLLRPSAERAVASEGARGIEYGVFRINNFYAYEWQDSSRRVYGETQNIFLDKMKLQSIAFRMGNLRDAPLSSLEYVMEAEMLNYFGSEGWELVEFIDKGMENRTFWFKRER